LSAAPATNGSIIRRTKTIVRKDLQLLFRQHFTAQHVAEKRAFREFDDRPMRGLKSSG
jgi:hypothetical protein